MASVLKTAAAVIAAVAAMGGAHATVLDLTLGNANVFAFNDFKAPQADVEGAIMAGRDVSLSNYSVNDKNVDAYGGYSLIVGRNFSFTSGAVMNGDTYVGGTSTLNQSGTLAKPVKGGAAPVDMAALAASLTRTSQALTQVATTGSAQQKWGGVYISGTNSAVEVIDLDASWLNSSSYYNLSNMKAGATLIVNFSGSSATFSGGYQAFDGYNVLFNFADATTLNIATGFTANVLAPNASVTDGSGVINGNVVVNNWNSGVQINANHYFVATDIPGLASAVPEAETYAMMLAGVGLVGLLARRRAAKATKAMPAIIMP
ncbi:choice-of-anchor A family protein [Oxalobacteraceae bacterium OTU3REALA1]|nr:choice-of-anchor A family protein [Oxalobacteraceae bacterium OTU3REALA1]